MIKARLYQLGSWCDKSDKRRLVNCGQTRTFKNRQQMRAENAKLRFGRHYKMWVEESAKALSSFNIVEP